MVNSWPSYFVHVFERLLATTFLLTMVIDTRPQDVPQFVIANEFEPSVSIPYD